MTVGVGVLATIKAPVVQIKSKRPPVAAPENVAIVNKLEQMRTDAENLDRAAQDARLRSRMSKRAGDATLNALGMK